MPTVYWYPISSATHDLPAGMDDWSNFGGANKNASTRVGGGREGPPTHDDGTTTVYFTADGTLQDQALNVDWPSPMSELPSGFTFTANFRSNAAVGTPSRSLQWVNAAGTTGGVIATIATAGAAYASHGPYDVSDAATYRPGGGSWALTDFDDEASLFPRLSTSSAAGNDANVTSIWGQIQYNVAGGMLPFFLGLVGTALPFVGRLTDLSQFRTYLDWRRDYHPRHPVLEAEEILQGWAEYRACRWVSFFV